MRGARIPYGAQQLMETKPPKPPERPSGDRAVPVPQAVASSDQQTQPLVHVVIDLGELRIPRHPERRFRSIVNTRSGGS
jgi:hypothetical protein